MAVTIGGLGIDPQAQTLVVDITPRAKVYSDEAGTTLASFPQTITDRTRWWVDTPGPYTVSVKRNGVEIANQTGGTLPVQIDLGVFQWIAPAVDRPGPEDVTQPGTTFEMSKYGSDPTGVADSAASMTSAITAAAAWINANSAPAVIDMDPGVYLWNNATVPKIPVGLAAELHIRTRGHVQVKLTSTSPRFLDIGRTADNQVFKNFRFTGPITIDCDNVGGKHHAFFGTWASGTIISGQRMDVQDVTIDGVTIINCPLGTSDNTDFRIGVAIWCKNNHSDPEKVIERVTVRNIHMDGGLQCVIVGATYASSSTFMCNYLIDELLIENIWHSCSDTPATALRSGVHVITPSRGHAGRITLRNITGYNSPDVGIEIDTAKDVLVEKCNIFNSFNHGYYHRHFDVPTDATEQRIKWVDCTFHRDLGSVANNTGGGWFAETVTLGDGTIVPSSPQVLTRCTYINNANVFKRAEAIDFIGCPRVTMQDVLVVSNFGDRNLGTNNTTGLVRVQGDANSATDTQIERLRVFVTGSNSGAGTLTFNLVEVGAGGTTTAVVKDPYLNASITNGIIRELTFGSLGNAGVSTKASLQRGKFVMAAGATSGHAIEVGDGTNTTTFSLAVTDADFAGIQTDHVDVNFQTPSLEASTSIVRSSEYPRARKAYLAPTSSIGESIDRGIGMVNSVTAMTSGQLLVVAIDLPAHRTINSIAFMSGSAAAVNPTHQWFVIADSALNVLGKTADDTSAAWAANTQKPLALATPFVTTYTGLYYVGVLVTATTTMPNFYGVLHSNQNANAVPPIRAASSTTGLTDPASLGPTLAALTATGRVPWVVVS